MLLEIMDSISAALSKSPVFMKLRTSPAWVNMEAGLATDSSGVS